MPSRRSEFLAGVRAELPILLGVIPFGLIYGALAVNAGLPAGVALGMSFIVFAGSAQFVGTQLIAGGAPALIIVLTTFVVNLRHMLYSASAAPHVQRLSPPWKWLLAYLLTDEAYVVTILHYWEPPDETYKHWFLLGAGLTFWGAWQLSSAAGVFLGAQVPASWALDFTLALTFIALVVPALKQRAEIAAALTAGLVALAVAGLPLKLGLIVAALTGIIVGLLVESTASERAWDRA